MSLTVSYSCWYLSLSFWTQRVAKYLKLSPIVVLLTLWFYGVAACMSLSSMLAGCL